LRSVGPGLLIQDTRFTCDGHCAGNPAPGTPVYSGETTLARLKRDPQELVSYLTRECSFPAGCLLMTGTGIVPEPGIRLQVGDEVRITIDPIGTLVNTMA
jgi:2-dehydro-3-deoxy-D-arabinonate dehydratase